MNRVLKPILFLFISFITLGLSAQCTISNLSIETEECIENNVYNFTFNFNIADNPNEFFDLYLNGAFYESYSLEDLPVTIEAFEGSASGVDTFLVCADDTENCCADFLIESPCPCDYYNVDYMVTSCTEDSLWFTLDFDYVNVSDSFLMGTPGFFIGTFHVNELPLQVGPFPRELTPAEVLISNQTDIFCFEPFIVDDEACDACGIYAISAVAGDCNDDQQFYLTLSFAYMNVGNEGFTVFGNGTNYGEFMYEDSILLDNGLYMDSLVLGPFPGDCETSREFVVADIADEGCSSTTELGPVCCDPPCDVFDIILEELECTSATTVSFYLNFDYENPGNDFFHLYSGDTHIGMFTLSDLPVFVEEFQVNEGETQLTVCINDQEDCCAQYIIEPLNCEDEICNIYDMVVDEVECTSNETIQFYLDFEVQNPESNFYEIYSNDEIVAYYPLNLLPMWIEDFPIHQEGETVISVCINDVEDCCEQIVLEELDCSGFECEIDDITYEIEFINLDSFILQLNFGHTGNEGDQFSVVGNGIEYGEFFYGALPVVLGPYNCHDSIPLEYVITDMRYPDCSAVLELGIVGCPVDTYQTGFDQIQVYTNSSTLIIKDPGGELSNAAVQIYSNLGQTFYFKKLESKKSIYRIGLPSLPPGIYFANISSKGKQKVHKFVLNR